MIGARLAADSCGGSHGFGKGAAPCSLLIPEGNHHKWRIIDGTGSQLSILKVFWRCCQMETGAALAGIYSAAWPRLALSNDRKASIG